MTTTSGLLTTITQHLSRLGTPLRFVLALALLAATIVLALLALDALATPAPISLAPFRW